MSSEREIRLDDLDRRCVMLVLSWYHHLRAGIIAAERQAEIDGLFDAPTARLSYIGSSTGKPSTPTQNRGIRLASGYTTEDAKDREIVRVVDEWLGALTSRQRQIALLMWGLDGRNEGLTRQQVGQKVGLNLRAIDYEVSRLLLFLAMHLRPVLPYLRDICRIRSRTMQ